MAVKSRQNHKQSVGPITILDITGNVTIGKGDIELREAFKQCLEKGERRFIFNLGKVGYMDSAGIGETVACHKRAAEHNAEIKIILVPRGKPDELFKITMLDRVFDIVHDEGEALASFRE